MSVKFHIQSIFFAVFLSTFILTTSLLAANPRERLLMDFGWRFQLGDPANADTTKLNYPEVAHLDKTYPTEMEEEVKLAAKRIDDVKNQTGSGLSFVQPKFDDREWKIIDLPHDWAVDLPFDSLNTSDNHIAHGFKAIGDKCYGKNNIGWYRRTFLLKKSDAGKSISIEFDGVYRNSLVWLNGHCLGRNVSGYSGFRYDISKFAIYGAKNTLVVRADANRSEGWWYEGAGIYRHVWLVKTNLLHVPQWGTLVTSTVEGKNALNSVQTEIQNGGLETDSFNLVSVIVDKSGKTVSQLAQNKLIVNAGQIITANQQLELKNVQVWSIENPYLYKLVTKIQKENQVIDEYETPFGIRTIHFDKDSGFYLNGKPVFVKGVCLHQDHAGVGTAIPDRLQYFRLEKLKEMGCNGVRTSHNQPTPELLEACDKLGLLVMDENRCFRTDNESKSQLEKLIRRDRNHPAVFIWSIGNEEMKVQQSEIGAKIVTKLQDICHKLDPTRPVTLAMNGAWGLGASTNVEIMGFNYLRCGNTDDYHKAFPNTPTIGTEEASSHGPRGIYRADEVRNFASSYLPILRSWSSTPEGWLQYYANRPWISGAFVWTGLDYRGEPVKRSWPSTTSCYGIMDLCGFPKDHFYLYQSAWTDKLVLHLMPHWNLSDSVGKQVKVWAYSNCEEVELFLNGKSVGKKSTIPNTHLEWMVSYVPGKLSAKGYTKGKTVKEFEVETTGKSQNIILSTDRKSIQADGEDLAMVTVSVTDANGNLIPNAENEITFIIKGAGKIIGVGNGNPSSSEPDKASKRKVFNGLAQVIIQATKQNGTIELSATSPGLQSKTIQIQSVLCKPRPAV